MFRSPVLKAQESFLNHFYPATVCKRFAFFTSSSEPRANFNQTRHKTILGKLNLSFLPKIQASFQGKGIKNS